MRQERGPRISRQHSPRLDGAAAPVLHTSIARWNDKWYLRRRLSIRARGGRFLRLGSPSPMANRMFELDPK